jgi:hypothetical protein
MKLTRAQLVKSSSTFMKPKDYNRVHKSQPLDPIVSQLNPVPILTSFDCSMYAYVSQLVFPIQVSRPNVYICLLFP